jgi:indolepyruvate ferredoxin oxidoreductase
VREVKLEDRYLLDEGRVYASGVQAFLRSIIDQRDADERAGLNTAAFVSGFPGSPISGFHTELERNRKLLDQRHIVFRPALNEDLAATAVWGTQLVGTLPQPK